MLFRSLFTAASLLLAAAAVLVIDCSTGSIAFLADDPLQVCEGVGALGIETSTWIGVGLAAASGLLLAMAWVPSLKPAEPSRRRLEPEEALRENLGRISSSATRKPKAAYTGAGHRADLIRRVEAVEVALMSESTAPKEATEQWMNLLREANDLRAQDLLSTEDFVEVNSRLVELINDPTVTVEEAAAR